MSRDGITIRPSGQSYSVGFENSNELFEIQSLKKARFVQAFYQHIRSFTNELFVIKKIGRREGSIIPVVIEYKGERKLIEVDAFNLVEEMDLQHWSRLTFTSPSTFRSEPTKEALSLGNFRDGFTLAATAYFEIKNKKVSEVPRQWYFFSPQSRIAVDGNNVVLTKRGLSRFERLVYRFFNTEKYETYMHQNAETIDAYKNFLVREVGEKKVALIEKTFGFSLDEMKADGHPLLPSHVHYFNTGMNHVEMPDVEAFAEKIKQPKKKNTMLDLLSTSLQMKTTA